MQPNELALQLVQSSSWRHCCDSQAMQSTSAAHAGTSNNLCQVLQRNYSYMNGDTINIQMSYITCGGDVKAQTGIETLIPVLHMVASMCTPSTLVAMVSGMKFLRSQIVVSGF